MPSTTLPPVDPARRRLLLAAVAATLAGYPGIRSWAASGTTPGFAPGSGLVLPQEAPPAIAPQTPGRLPEASGRGHEVLVLGAGIAGLVAAYELHLAGCRVRVLEARERVGGRCWTLRGGDRVVEYGGAEQTCQFPAGEYLNAGANRILPGHRGVLDYVHRFGLPLELFASGPQSETWVLRRTPGHPLTGQKLRFRQLNRDEIGHALAKLLELLGPAADPSGEAAALAAWARRFGELDPAGRYAGSPARGYRIPPGGADRPGELETPLDAAELWSYGALCRIPAEVNSPAFPTPVLTLTGGMDHLPKALAAALPPDCLQLGAEVVRLRQDASGVTVTWKDLATGALHEERAQQTVCTLPFTLLSRIDSDFTPPIQAIIGALAYEPIVKVGLDFRRRFWERDDGIYGGYSFMDDPNLILMYPSQGLGQEGGDYRSPWEQAQAQDQNLGSGAGHRPATGQDLGGGLVTLYYPASRDSLRVTGLDPEARIQAGLRDLEYLHPGVRQDLRSAVSVPWSRIPWSAGCAGAWTDKARKQDLPRLAAGDRRVLFAGEHISHIPAWMEGSVQSAHAALDVLRQQWQSQPEAVS